MSGESLKPVIGKCRMCLKEQVELHGESHILPEFMYRRMPLGKIHPKPFRVLDPTSPNTDPLMIEMKNNKGEWESCVFCRVCEDKFSLLDDYGAKFLAGDSIKLHFSIDKQNQKDKFIELSGINYTKLKLFILSLFIRASLSARQNIQFKLSELHERRISNMIVNMDAGDALDYPVYFQLFTRTKMQNYNVLVYPLKLAENHFVLVYGNNDIEGIMFNMHTDISDIKAKIVNNVLNENGTLSCLVFNDKARDLLIEKIIKIPSFRKFGPTENNTTSYIDFLRRFLKTNNKKSNL